MAEGDRSTRVWGGGGAPLTWLEAQLNHASQTEPPCQRKLFMLNLPPPCCSSPSPAPAMPMTPTSSSLPLPSATMASSSCSRAILKRPAFPSPAAASLRQSDRRE